jgi:type III pantothenate kinase
MILTIDIGNTICKIGIINDHNFIHFSTSRLEDLVDDIQVLLEKHPISSLALCSVNGDTSSIIQQFSNQLEVFEVNKDILLPFTNLYTSPTLGHDRMALVAGAMNQERQAANLLIIDAGTCVTYDFVDEDKIYHGGAISPGVYMRFKALHTFTSKLPLIEPATSVSVTGNSTESSIRSGVQHGLSMEIDGMIDHYRSRYKNLKVFLTGGDAVLLSGLLKNRFFAAPNLMLQGIYSLYLFNKKI